MDMAAKIATADGRKKPSKFFWFCRFSVTFHIAMPLRTVLEIDWKTCVNPLSEVDGNLRELYRTYMMEFQMGVLLIVFLPWLGSALAALLSTNRS